MKTAKRSFGYGFIAFPDHEAALKCKEEGDRKIINGRSVKVSWPHRNCKLKLSKSNHEYML